MTIKTTKKNHIYTVMKRVGDNWRRIEDAIFTMRKNARACCQELNSINPIRKGGKALRRYRVVKMTVASPRRS